MARRQRAVSEVGERSEVMVVVATKAERIHVRRDHAHRRRAIGVVAAAVTVVADGVGLRPTRTFVDVNAPDRLYFRQLLSGRDIARSDPVARQMVNFVYLIGDRETGEAAVVDAAYDVRGILDVAAADGMKVSRALVTHYHQDHVGGDMMGYQISGVRELLALNPVPIHVQADEAHGVQRVTGAGETDLVRHRSGDVVDVGAIGIELIHTPGHTPGSQCFFVDGRYLVSGDTLFLEGCGRTDLPGGDPAQLYDSLTHRLAKVPDDTVLFPGHLYSAEPSATMGETRQWNYVFKPRSEAEWLAMFGG